MSAPEVQLLFVICVQAGQRDRLCHVLLSEQLWALLWSAAFAEARAPISGIIGEARACKGYAFIMKRLSVLLNRKRESSDKTRKGLKLMEWKL